MGDVSDSVDIPVSKYIAHMKTTGKLGGAKTSGSLLNSFEKWLDARAMSIEDITINTVDEYLSTVGSAQPVLNAIRGYFRYRYTSLPMGHPAVMTEMQRYNQLSLVRPKRKPKKLAKVALTTEELSALLKKMKQKGVSEELYAGIVVLFYFGARPGEMAEYLATARISFEKREMFIQTEKTHVERYLAWSPALDPYIKLWYKFVTADGRKGLPYPGQWLTMKLKYEMGSGRVTGGVRVTSRTARKTFQTQMRLLNVPDIIIRAILGHTDNTMSDVYTDWTQFAPIIRENLLNTHYMIKGGLI